MFCQPAARFKLEPAIRTKPYLAYQKILYSFEFHPPESDHSVPGNMTLYKSTAFILNISPFIHIFCFVITKNLWYFITRKACNIRGFTLRHRELPNKVKRTVIFHFIETSACTLPLFLLLSLHVSLILSLQATLSLVPPHPHTFPHCPCTRLLSLPPSRRQLVHLINSELSRICYSAAVPFSPVELFLSVSLVFLLTPSPSLSLFLFP